MEDYHKKILKKRRLILAKDLVGVEVFQFLVEKEILSDHLVEKINSKDTSFERNVEFLTILPKRGPNAFQNFIDSLHASDQSYLVESIISVSKDIVNIQSKNSVDKNEIATVRLSTDTKCDNIQSDLEHIPASPFMFTPVQQSVNDLKQNQLKNISRKRLPVENKEQLNQSFHLCSPSWHKKQCIDTNNDETALEDVIPSPCGPLDDILSTSPNNSLVKKSCLRTPRNNINISNTQTPLTALSCDLADGPCLKDLILRAGCPPYQRSHFYDCYEMTSLPRGLALIISVDHYEPSACLDDRQAGEVDRARLEFVLRQLGFKCYILVDGTGREIADVLQKFVALEDHDRCNATILVVMSHGEEGCFFGRDGSRVYIDKVIESFSNSSCVGMQNKPKILLFQCCRGSLPDKGVDEADAPGRPTLVMMLTNGNTLEDRHKQLPAKKEAPEADLSSSRSSLGSERSYNKLPTQSDYLIGYATVKGFAALRNKRGSWYIGAFVQVLAYHACDKHLIEMMTIVNDMVKGREGNSPATDFHRCKEMSVFHSTLCKKLYLFPPS